MNREADERIKKALKKNHACYVLITCDESSEEGVMQVEMSYEGDPIVAAYLLQGAQSIMEEQEIDQEETCCSDKIEPLQVSSNL